MTSMGGMEENPLSLLPELFLLLGAVAGLLLGLWTPQHRQGRVRLVALIACGASAVAAGAAMTQPAQVVFDGVWTIDLVTGTVRLSVAAATALTIGLASPTFDGHPRQSEAYVLMLLGALGADALAAASDLLLLVAAYLLASVPLYALAGFAKDAAGVEATVKYYLMGALVGVLLLVGVAALVLATGLTGYPGLAQALPAVSRPLVAVGVLGVVAGVLFKAGAVPVHFWVPDVADGATTPAAAFITTVPKLGAVAAAFRLLSEAFVGVDLDVSLLVAVVATASMTLGNLGAFAQESVRRLLGYSTISQVGYLLMVVAVAARTDAATPALAVYLAAYAVTNVGAFAAAAAVPAATVLGSWRGTGRQHPWLLVSLAVCLLGLVGTPPTAVFVGKLTVFAATADGGLFWLVVVAAVNTVASLFYYLRWIAPAFGSAQEGATPAVLARTPASVLHACAAASLVLGAGVAIALSLVV